MHFDVWVIMDAGSDVPMPKAIATALAPFDMNRNLRARELPCLCVGEVAHAWGRAQAQRDLPEIAHAVGAGHDAQFAAALARANTEEERQRASAENHARYMTEVKPLEMRLQVAAEEYARAHPLHDRPTPDCRWCQGAGVTQETMNPDGHWDYYTVQDIVPARYLIDQDARAYAVVSGGTWQELPLGGTPAQRAGAERAWHHQSRALLEANPESSVAIVDCHG